MGNEKLKQKGIKAMQRNNFGFAGFLVLFCILGSNVCSAFWMNSDTRYKARLNQARREISNKKFADAREVLEGILLRDYKLTHTFFYLYGKTLFNLAIYKDAEENLKKCLAMSPTYNSVEVKEMIQDCARHTEEFSTNGKDWKKGPLNPDLKALEPWAKKLGLFWRIPTIDELRKLQADEKVKTQVGKVCLWGKVENGKLHCLDMEDGKIVSKPLKDKNQAIAVRNMENSPQVEYEAYLGKIVEFDVLGKLISAGNFFVKIDKLKVEPTADYYYYYLKHYFCVGRFSLGKKHALKYLELAGSKGIHAREVQGMLNQIRKQEAEDEKLRKRGGESPGSSPNRGKRF